MSGKRVRLKKWGKECRENKRKKRVRWERIAIRNTVSLLTTKPTNSIILILLIKIKLSSQRTLAQSKNFNMTQKKLPDFKVNCFFELYF